MSGVCTPKQSPLSHSRHRSQSVVLINDEASAAIDAMATLDAQPPAHRRHTAKGNTSEPHNKTNTTTATTAPSSQKSRRLFGKNVTNTTAARTRTRSAGKSTAQAQSPFTTQRALSSSTGAGRHSQLPPRLDTQAIFGTTDMDTSLSVHRGGRGHTQTLTHPPAMGAFPKGKVKHAVRAQSASTARSGVGSGGARANTRATATSKAESHVYDYAYHVRPLYTRSTDAAQRNKIAARTPPPPGSESLVAAPSLTPAARQAPLNPAAGNTTARTVGQLFDRRTSLIERYAAATGVSTAVDGQVHASGAAPGLARASDDYREWSSDDDSDHVPDALKPLQGATGQELYLRRAPSYDPAHPLSADSDKPFLAMALSRPATATAATPMVGAQSDASDPANKDSALFTYLSSYKMGEEAPTAGAHESAALATFDASASPLQSAMKRTSPPSAAETGAAAGAVPPPPVPPVPGGVAPPTAEAPTLTAAASSPTVNSAAQSLKTVRFADDAAPPPPQPPMSQLTGVPVPAAATTLATVEQSTATTDAAASSQPAAAPAAPPPAPVPTLTPGEKARQDAEQSELKLLKELAEADARLRSREQAKAAASSAPPPSTLEELLGASSAAAPAVRQRVGGNFYGWQAPPANVLLPSIAEHVWYVPSSAKERMSAEQVRLAAVALLDAEQDAHRRGFRGVRVDDSGDAVDAGPAKAPHNQNALTALVHRYQSDGGEVDYQACFEDISCPERVTQRLYAAMEAQAREANAAPTTTTKDAEIGAGQFMLYDALPPPADDLVTTTAGHGDVGRPVGGGAQRTGTGCASQSTLATQAVVLRSAVSLLSCEHLAKDVGIERAVTRTTQGLDGSAALQGEKTMMVATMPRGPSQSTAIASSVLQFAPPSDETISELSYPAKVLLSAILYVRALGGLPTLLRVQPLTAFSPVKDKNNCLELVFLNPAKMMREEARRQAEQVQQERAEAERQRLAALQQQQQDQSAMEPASTLVLGRQRGRSAPASPIARSLAAGRHPSNVESQLVSVLNSHVSQRRRSSSLTGQSLPGEPRATRMAVDSGPSLSFSGDTTPLPFQSTQADPGGFADISYVQENSEIVATPQRPSASAFLAAVASGANSAESSAASLSQPLSGRVHAVDRAAGAAVAPQPSILRRMGSERWSAPRVDVATTDASRRHLRRSSSAGPVHNIGMDDSDEDRPAVGPVAADDSTRTGRGRAETSRLSSGSGESTSLAAEKEAQWRSAVSAALDSGKTAGTGRAQVSTPLPPPRALKPPSTPTRKGEPHVDPIEDELCVVVRAVLADKSTVHRFGHAETVHVLPPLPPGEESLTDKVARENAMRGGVEALLAGRLGESAPLMKLLSPNAESMAQRRQLEANRKLYMREQMKRHSARGPIAINEDGKPTAEDYGDLIVALLLSGDASQLSGVLPDSMELESLRYKIFSLQGYSAKDPFGINRAQNQKRSSLSPYDADGRGLEGLASGAAPSASSPQLANWTRTHSIASVTSLFGGANGESAASGGRASRRRGAAAGRYASPETSVSMTVPSTAVSGGAGGPPGVRGRSASVESVLFKHFGPTAAMGVRGLGVSPGDASDRPRTREEADRLRRRQSQFPVYRASSVSESTLQAYHTQERQRAEARARQRQQGRCPSASARDQACRVADARSASDEAASDKNRELREAEQELLRFRPLRLDCFYAELVEAVQFALDMQVRQTKEKVMQAFHM